VNREPVLELQLQVSMPSPAGGEFQRIGFHDLGSMVATAMESSRVWDAHDVFLSDVFLTPEVPAAAARAPEGLGSAVADAAAAAAASPAGRLWFRRLGDLQQQGDGKLVWALVVALRHPPEDSHPNVSEKIYGGAANLAVHLQAALFRTLGQPVRVTVKDLTLYCPGGLRADKSSLACRTQASVWFTVLAVCLVLCALAAAGGGVWVCRRRGLLCFRREELHGPQHLRRDEQRRAPLV